MINKNTVHHQCKQIDDNRIFNICGRKLCLSVLIQNKCTLFVCFSVFSVFVFQNNFALSTVQLIVIRCYKCYTEFLINNLGAKYLLILYHFSISFCYVFCLICTLFWCAFSVSFNTNSCIFACGITDQCDWHSHSHGLGEASRTYPFHRCFIRIVYLCFPFLVLLESSTSTLW